MANKKGKWQKFNTHYSDKDGIKSYTEWEQKGDEIRNHEIYKKVN